MVVKSSNSSGGGGSHLLFPILVLTILLLQSRNSNGQQTHSEQQQNLRDVQMSYVIEPFEGMENDNQYRFQNLQNENENERLNITLSSNDSLFGNHSWRIEYQLNSSSKDANESNAGTNFGWVHNHRPHNCYGATHLSLWYKIPDLADNEELQHNTGKELLLRLTLYDDYNCVVTSSSASVEEAITPDCSDINNLDAYLVMEQSLDNNQRDKNDWQELRVAFSTLDKLHKTRIRGWKIDIVLIDKDEAYVDAEIDTEIDEAAAVQVDTDIVVDSVEEGEFYSESAILSSTESIYSSSLPMPSSSVTANESSTAMPSKARTVVPTAAPKRVTKPKEEKTVKPEEITTKPLSNKQPLYDDDSNKRRALQADDTNTIISSTSSPSSSSSSTVSGVVLVDQLACLGGGEMFGAALHIDDMEFKEYVKEFTWIETYFQSNRSQELSYPSLRNGHLRVNYTVEQVETWGGFVAYHHLAPGSGYYNLSLASEVAFDYYIEQAASIPERAIVRLVLQDGSDCVENCDFDYEQSHERFYSFISILDLDSTTTANNREGQIRLPLVGSTSPETPFWLTGWSGVMGNSHLDLSKIKGFSLEIVLDSQLDMGTLVSGVIEFSNIIGLEVEEPTSDGIESVKMSYVMEPFEAIEEDSWFHTKPLQIENEENGVDFILAPSNDALFGNYSLRVDYTLLLEEDEAESNRHNVIPVYFGWIQELRPHNCYGATHLSLWYKMLTPIGVHNASREQRLRLILYDDTNCIETHVNKTECSNPDNLHPTVVLNVALVNNKKKNIGEEDWQELKVPLWAFADYDIDLKRIRGWKIEIFLGMANNYKHVNISTFTTSSSATAIINGTILVDQLACLGNGDMFGSAFHIGNSNSFEDSIAGMTWQETYFQSNISETLSDASLKDGILRVNYTVEQVETWGGFVSYHHLAPGSAYYNISAASDVAFDYYIERAASIPERAIFRLVLQDNSDCIENCDWDYEKSHERFYSFISILDIDSEEGRRGKIILPLVGSTSPDTPFWLTGWSGIMGNSKFDLSEIKGFTLEMVLDSQLEMGSLVSGVVSFSNLAGITVSDANETVEGLYVVESGLYFFENSPQFTRLEFLGSKCGEVCRDDPDCLYALSTGRDCYVAPYIYPSFVGVIDKVTQNEFAAFWMDDAAKRGDFCDLCVCLESDRAIDCRGKELVILPKTFSIEGTWTPRILDLTENPNLILLGSGSLSAIGETLEELRLPVNLKYIAIDSLKDLPNLVDISFEDEEFSASANGLTNVIKAPYDSFSDVCCSRGSRLELDIPSGGLTFCNMQMDEPGIDSIYEPFYSYGEATTIQVLRPSSPLMAEAAESVEKCAEYCTISPDCLYFQYDARIKNAEHACHLLSNDNSTRGKHKICCDLDHYQDEAMTLPGWTAGRPPRTRHFVDNAAVLAVPATLSANFLNSYIVQYTLSLGSTPLRGAVWIEPKVKVSRSSLNVLIRPSRVALYDENMTVTVTLEISNIDESFESSSLIIENVVASCDTAFTLSADNTILIEITAPPEVGSGSLVTIIAVIVPLLLFVVIGLGVWIYWQQSRRVEDSVWAVNKNEIKFKDPPEILGRGTFGLVLLAEYRGTEVAVKRAIPPRSMTDKRVEERSVVKKHNDFSISFDNISEEGDYDEEMGDQSTGGSTPSATELQSAASTRKMQPMESVTPGNKSWTGLGLHPGMASGIGGKSGTFSMGAVSGVGGKSSTYGMVSRLMNRNSDSAAWNRLKEDFIEEMRHLSKLRHPCITTVMGAVVGKNIEPMLVMEYMDHGSLYDLLHNETMVMAAELLLPILRDISQGMRFLHSATPQVIHGDLKAQNILVDNKFRAKVADFGLSQKKNMGATGTPYWMAPELLRGESENTAPSDIYSFGIILYEVYSRRDPYEGEDFKEVLLGVTDKSINKRPPIPPACPPQVVSLMGDCLVGEPDQRPTFEELDNRLKRVEVDNMELVGSDEDSKLNKRATVSLFDIFPPKIAEALRDGCTVEPEHRDVVTIFFSDIVGFTTISSDLPPRKIANLLDRLYQKFDDLSHKHDVFKVETIGDAWMGVTNLIKDQSNDHAKRIANFAFEAVKAAREIYIDEDDTGKGCVNIRVGFHSGSVVADVVGTRNPRYCLFGDAVNTASRMESNSRPNRIHCSISAATILKEQSPDVMLFSRGEIDIKGKGRMETFWVREPGSRRSSNDSAGLREVATQACNELHAVAESPSQEFDSQLFKMQ